MTWLLLLLIIPAVPLALGFFLGFLVFVLPGVNLKAKLACRIASLAYRPFGPEASLMAVKHMDWRVRSRWGDKGHRPLYAEILKRSEGDR